MLLSLVYFVQYAGGQISEGYIYIQNSGVFLAGIVALLRSVTSSVDKPEAPVLF